MEKSPENMKEVKLPMVGIFVTVMICGGIGMTTLSLCTAAKWGDEAPTSDRQS